MPTARAFCYFTRPMLRSKHWRHGCHEGNTLTNEIKSIISQHKAIAATSAKGHDVYHTIFSQQLSIQREIFCSM